MLFFMGMSLLGGAHAQGVWGLEGGAWERLSSPLDRPPPSLAYRGATHVAGSIIVTNNASLDIGGMGATMYDVANARWEAWPDLPIAMADPAMFEVGGQVFVVDETNLLSMCFIDANGARSTVGWPWTVPTILDAPPPTRYGMRFAVWGTIVYTFGGVDNTTGVAHNDLWALPAGTVVTGFSLPYASWAQAAGDGMPGFPPGRVGYSFTAFGTAIVLFGGVSVLPSAPPGTLPDVCFDPTQAAAHCDFHSHVWVFTPGNPGPPGELKVTGDQWRRLGGGGAPGGAGPAPTGRFDHISGAISDQLFVYGGTTASGPSTDMWAYNLLTQVWGKVVPTQPAPDAASPGDAGYGVGSWMGHHFYRFRQEVDASSGMPVSGTGQLWRWAPAAVGGAMPAPSSPAQPATGVTLASGPTAGITLSVMLGLANAFMLLLLGRSSGAFGSLDALGGCGGWCTAKRGAGGYYATSSSSDKAEGAYSAPSI